MHILHKDATLELLFLKKLSPQLHYLVLPPLPWVSSLLRSFPPPPILIGIVLLNASQEEIGTLILVMAITVACNLAKVPGPLMVAPNTLHVPT